MDDMLDLLESGESQGFEFNNGIISFVGLDQSNSVSIVSAIINKTTARVLLRNLLDYTGEEPLNGADPINTRGLDDIKDAQFAVTEDRHLMAAGTTQDGREVCASFRMTFYDYEMLVQDLKFNFRSITRGKS